MSLNESINVTWRTGVLAIIVFAAAFGFGYWAGQAAERSNDTEVAIATAPAPANLVLFSCPTNKYIAAHFEDGNVRLALSDGRKFTVPQVISGDGAQYMTSDESVTFWTKGNNAMLQEYATATYNNCIEIEPVITTDRAPVTPASSAVVTPTAILEDSRCAIGATCIWEGTVRVRAKVAVEGRVEEAEFSLNQTKTILGKKVTLTNVAPEPMQGIVLPFSSYRFTFDVK